jgi:hypothetical protein
MSTQQLPIDFTQPLVHRENNKESQALFEENKDRFSAQCRIAYDAMMQGERLTTAKALIEYGIGDLRRRVKDLKDMWGVPVQSVIVQGKFKEYFINID